MSELPTSNLKLYAERDHAAQGQTYAAHLLAMTTESMYSKSAIAAELAHRDIEIEQLRAEIKERKFFDNLPKASPELIAEAIRQGKLPVETAALHGLQSISFDVSPLPKVNLVMTFDTMTNAQAARAQVTRLVGVAVETKPDSITKVWKRFARAFNRLQCADIPRGPWHDEVSDLLLFGDLPVETTGGAGDSMRTALADLGRSVLDSWKEKDGLAERLTQALEAAKAELEATGLELIDARAERDRLRAAIAGSTVETKCLACNDTGKVTDTEGKVWPCYRGCSAGESHDRGA